MKQKHLQIVSILFLFFFMTACASTNSVPPVINAKTSTPTEFVPTATHTPTETSTPEIKQFKICTPENFRDCPLTIKEVTDGTYLQWLGTLSKPFDPEQIRTDVPLMLSYDANGPTRIPDTIGFKFLSGGSPYFTGANEGKEPVRRDVTAGYLDLKDSQGRLWKYVFLPTEYYDVNNPTVNQWVINALSYPMWWYPYSDAEIDQTIKVWREEMNVTPIYAQPTHIKIPNEVDPLISMTFKKYTDMNERFLKFANNNSDKPGGDLSVLSQPGIIVSTFVRSGNKALQ